MASPTAPARCAVCHAELAPAATVRCPGCATALHAECGAELGRCPTLGCADPTLGTARPAPADAAPGLARKIAWVAFGLLLPALCFLVDDRVRIDPVAWGRPYQMFPEPEAIPEPSLRAWVVRGLAGLACLGLVLLLARRPRAAAPLLWLGVVLAATHAVVFVKLLPLSLIALLLLAGFLGFVPYLTAWVYADALRRAGRLAAPKGERPGLGTSPWPPLLLGAALGGGVLLAPRDPVPFPAPAARKVERLSARDLADLRGWAAQVRSRAPRAQEAPDRFQPLWRKASVSAEPGHVAWEWEDDPRYPYGYRLYALAPGVDLPPAPGTCYRSVEVAPGIWSQYLVKGEPPGDQWPVFVRLPVTAR
jgi:hypothetical protein